MLRADPGRRAPGRSTRETWFDHAVLALALVLLLTGFGTIVTGNDWWVTTLLIALMSGLTCAVLRGLGFRFVAPVAVVVELLALAWIFVPETLSAFLPTLDTVRGLNHLAYTARIIIVEERAPVGAAEPIVLVVAASFGLIVIVADLLLQTRRAAALIGILLVAVYATPALISGETPSVWLFVSVAALWLVLLRSRTATTAFVSRGSSPALVLGGGALVAAMLFPVVSPDVGAVATGWGKPPSTVFGRGINPMLELGQNLRRNSSVTALTYTTELRSAPYLKVATLRDFSGKTWRPATTPGLMDQNEGQVVLRSDIDVEPVRTTVSIRNLRSSMLPVPYPALPNVIGLEGAWRFNRVGLTLSSETADSRGQTYTVTSLDREPTAEQMRSIDSFIGSSVEPYLVLPADMPEVIAETARKVTANADNNYDRAMALQAWFRSEGGFRYSETAPVADDYDGNGVGVIAKFLDVKAGYCVHFSSAMAVMARSLGIPARIAVGYAPGSPVGQRNGDTEYKVTSDDLHAWPELYFQGVGWVQFEPTTSIGSATAFFEPASDPTSDTGGAAPETTTGGTRGADRVDSGTPTSSSSSPAQTASRSALVIVPGLLLVCAVPWLVRWVRRQWRLSRGGGSVDPLWRELEDLARDHGIAVSAADTPRGFAARLRRRPGIDVTALDALLRRVERERFARDADVDGNGLADLRAVARSIRAGAGKRERLRATLLPESIAGRAPVLRFEPGTEPAT
ncbi:MAG: hypothetical protein JWR27_246 [Aeromicrobium sp.]|nr:hypothetical protein [Aeromicrobium sp.]